MRRFAPILLLLALVPFFLGMSKKPKFTLTIHSQGEEMDMSKSMFPVDIGGRRVLFKIVPEISQENVVAYHPFQSENGNGMGVALQLEMRGRGALEIVTRTHHGEYLLALVNGKPVDYLVIDRPVSDGLITIWQGITPEVIAEMEKKYPHIKPHGPPTMSENMEMVPSTPKERRKAKKEAERAKKDEEKARKSGKPTTPEIPSLPAAPMTPAIPSEGGTGATPAPADTTPAAVPSPPGSTAPSGTLPLPTR